MSRMGFSLLLAGGAVTFSLTIMAAQKIDHFVNYSPVDATITEVESTCYLKQEESGVLSKTTRTTDTLPCSKAETLLANHPEYADMAVKGMITVGFDYTSPANQSHQTGALKYAYEDYPDVARLHAGADLPILASKRAAAKVAQDFDRLD